MSRQRRITVDEYHRMIEAGILDEDEHVQLIDGFLVAMTPQGEPHAQVIQRLNRLLVRSVGEGLVVRPRSSKWPRTRSASIAARKAVLYARAGIPEYWIVSLEESTVEVLRDPDASAGAYRAAAARSRNGLIRSTRRNSGS